MGSDHTQRYRASDLSYDEMTVDATGQVLSNEAKAEIRKQYGYCLTCTGDPTQLFAMNRSRLNPLWTKKRPQTVVGKSKDGRCLVCKPLNPTAASDVTDCLTIVSSASRATLMSASSSSTLSSKLRSTNSRHNYLIQSRNVQSERFLLGAHGTDSVDPTESLSSSYSHGFSGGGYSQSRQQESRSENHLSRRDSKDGRTPKNQPFHTEQHRSASPSSCVHDVDTRGASRQISQMVSTDVGGHIKNSRREKLARRTASVGDFSRSVMLPSGRKPPQRSNSCDGGLEVLFAPTPEIAMGSLQENSRPTLGPRLASQRSISSRIESDQDHGSWSNSRRQMIENSIPSPSTVKSLCSSVQRQLSARSQTTDSLIHSPVLQDKRQVPSQSQTLRQSSSRSLSVEDILSSRSPSQTNRSLRPERMLRQSSSRSLGAEDTLDARFRSPVDAPRLVMRRGGVFRQSSSSSLGDEDILDVRRESAAVSFHKSMMSQGGPEHRRCSLRSTESNFLSPGRAREAGEEDSVRQNDARSTHTESLCHRRLHTLPPPTIVVPKGGRQGPQRQWSEISLGMNNSSQSLLSSQAPHQDLQRQLSQESIDSEGNRQCESPFHPADACSRILQRQLSARTLRQPGNRSHSSRHLQRERSNRSIRSDYEPSSKGRFGQQQRSSIGFSSREPRSLSLPGPDQVPDRCGDDNLRPLKEHGEPIAPVVEDLDSLLKVLVPSGSVELIGEVIIDVMDSNQTEEQLQRYCLQAIVRIFKQRPDDCSQLISLGIHVRVLRALQRFSTSIGIFSDSSEALISLAASDPDRIALVHSGVCIPFGRALSQFVGDPRWVSAAIRFLLAVTGDFESHGLLEELRVTEKVVRAMEHNSSHHEIQSEGCVLLATLARTSDPNLVASVGKDVILSVLGVMLNHPMQQAVLVNAVGALRTLTCNETNLRFLAHAAGAVDTLRQVSAFGKAQENATVVLERIYVSLAQDGSLELRALEDIDKLATERYGDSVAVDMILQTLDAMKWSSRVTEAALGALVYLSSRSNSFNTELHARTTFEELESYVEALQNPRGRMVIKTVLTSVWYDSKC